MALQAKRIMPVGAPLRAHVTYEVVTIEGRIHYLDREGNAYPGRIVAPGHGEVGLPSVPPPELADVPALQLPPNRHERRRGRRAER